MSLNLALVISGQSAGAAKAVQETRAEVRELGADAGRTSAAMVAANDQAVASSQRVVQALTAQTEAQQKMQAAVAAFAGIKPANDDAGYRQRAGDIEAYGQELDRIRAKYVPLFAVEQEHVKALREIDQARKVGAISAAEQAAAVDGVTVVYNRQTAALRTVGGAARLTSNQLLNLSRQGNDVVTMFALGIPPMQIFASQAGQIYDALESGPKGLRGSLEAISALAKKAVMNLLAFAATPAGFTAVAAVAATATVAVASYFMRGDETIEKLDANLKKHVDLLKQANEGWKELPNSLRGIPGESPAVVSFMSRAAAADLRKSVQAQTGRGLLGALGAEVQTDFFTDVPLVQGLPFGLGRKNDYEQLKPIFTELFQSIKDGPGDVAKFNDKLALLGSDPATSSGLRERIAQILDLTRAIGDAQRTLQAYDRNIGPGGLLIGGSEFNRRDQQGLEKWQRERDGTLRQNNAQFEAQLFGLHARSPAELAEAARRQASAVRNSDEDGEVRRQRVAIAGRLAQAQAEKALKDAQDERKRSLDATLASQQLDIDLIGKTVGQAAQMRLQFQLTQELREEAERNNTRIDQDELDRIATKAKALGQLVDLTARLNLASDLQFERDQLGRSPIEQTVAARLKGAGLEVDLGSYDAGLVRTNEILKQHVELWKDVRQTGMDAIDAVTASAAKGFSDFGDVVEDIAQDVTKQLMQLVVANPLKNAIYGAGLPTLSDVGGVGGFLGTLLGMTPNPAAGVAAIGGQSVAAMTVNAGSVTISGGLGVSGGNGIFDRLFNPSNGNADMSAFREAIKSIESAGSGGYSALGPVVRGGDQALGAYGIMASNLPSWSQDALGRAVSRSEFMASPSIQDAVFDHRFGGYVDKYGASGAASMWFTGRPSAPDATDALGTSGSAYVAKFNAAVSQATRNVGSLGGATGTAADGLGNLGNGLSQFGSNLSKVFPAAPSGGGLGNLLSSLFGGGSLNSAFAGSNAYSWLSANPGGYIGLFDRGGATGGNDPRRVAGLVHEEEYVMDAPVVRAVGVPFLDKLRAAAKAGRGFDGGGYGGGAYFAGGGQRPAGMVVNIFDQREAGAPQVEQRSRIDEDGQQQLDIYIRRTTQDEVGRPSAATNRQLRSAYGLTPQVVRR